MTPLELALTSEEKMEAFLELSSIKDIIDSIKEYHNADRTVIATSVLCGLVSGNDNHGLQCNYGPIEEQTQLAVKYADSLIAELKK